MHPADVQIHGLEVDRDGTVERPQLSAGSAIFVGGVNFPDNAVSRSGMRGTIVAIGVGFQKSGKAERDLSEAADDAHAAA